MTDLVTTVLASAAVGALVSSAVALVGQSLERRARQRELLLGRSLDLARARTAFIWEIIKRKQDKGESIGYHLSDDIILAEQYHRALKMLLDTGKLPEDLRRKQAEQERRIKEARSRGESIDGMFSNEDW